MKIRDFIFFYIKKPIKSSILPQFFLNSSSILLQTVFKCILLKILKSLSIEVMELHGMTESTVTTAFFLFVGVGIPSSR